ncbi:prepilin-type N-terminal cleavage/methylation domain-containing protein [Salmonella enterica]
MVSKSIIKGRIRKYLGFSLLEIIIALAIVGIVMVTLTSYVRKISDERYRQIASEAIAQDIYGVLQFVNADSIDSEVVENGVRQKKKVTNPLYNTSLTAVYPDAEAGSPDLTIKGLVKNPIWKTHPHANQVSLDAETADVSPYIARNYSTGITNPVSNSIKISEGTNTYYSHSLKWSQSVWQKGSVRGYFTDSGCQNRNASAVYFNQQFLSCNENPVLKNSEIAIVRIDLISDRGSFPRKEKDPESPVGIRRVDVFISFTPLDNNPARIEQYITPLMTALRLKKISPNADAVYLVMQQGAVASNSWSLLDKTNGQHAINKTLKDNLALLSDLPDMTGKLDKSHTYGIRLSFDGNGNYLRTDGLNAATKVCWNTSSGVAGPCLISPAQDALVLKRRDDLKEFANLQVRDVISVTSYTDDQGNIKEDYYTAPHIQYKAFDNVGVRTPLGPYYRNQDGHLCDVDNNCTGISGPNTDQVADPKNGAIRISVQNCPVADGFIRPSSNSTDPDKNRLYPRLSATVSSVIAGLTKTTDGHLIDAQAQSAIFHKQEDNLAELNRMNSNTSINRLGGVVFQISQSVNVNNTNEWRIGALVGTEDTNSNGHPWQYYNPPWLSVMITTWCSSVKQDTQ